MRILDVGCATFDRPAEFFPDVERIVTRLDIDPAVNPDVVHDITVPLPEAMQGAFDVVICSHVLEHVPWAHAIKAIENIGEAVAKDGELVIAIPDLEWCARKVLKGEIDLGLMGTLFGGQSDPFDVHQCGYTRASMRGALERLGWTVKSQYQTGVNIIIMGHPSVSYQIVTWATR